MFTRRKSRNVHGTSYTGVNHVAPSDSQPNDHAVAAALSIGYGLAGNGGGQPIRYNVSRTVSLRDNSLKKRNSISSNDTYGIPKRNLLRVSSNNSLTSVSLRRRSSNGNGYGPQLTSFDNSIQEELEEPHSEHYNRRSMQDLMLPQKPFANGYKKGPEETGLVKMIKKYIPTPNGIKIIEVPEEKFNQEVARNNSMRSGRGIARSPSLNSLSRPRAAFLNGVSTPKRNTSSRLSSLMSSPRMQTMNEVDEVKGGSMINNEEKYDELLKQIEHEKHLAKELDSKTTEYQKLKQKRLEKEKNLALLRKQLSNVSSSPSSSYSDLEKDIQDNIRNRNTDSNLKSPFIADGLKEDIIKTAEETSSRSSQKTVEQKENGNPIFNQPVLQLTDEKIPEASASELALQDEVIGRNSIDASSVIVDELDKKNHSNSDMKDFIGASSNGQHLDDNQNEDGTELKIIRQYEGLRSTELFGSGDDDLGSHEDDNESNLAKQLRPTFDAVPEIIKEDDENENVDLQSKESLITSGINSSSSSLNSTGYVPLSKGKSPPKSAMKKSTPATKNEKHSQMNVNPAHYAYLSLTTAENTRLNSKLSASKLNTQLNAAQQPPPFQGFHMSQPLHQNNNPRMSQTLRKTQVPTTPTGMSGRTLRPNTLDPYLELYNYNGGMPGRGPRSHMSMQPVATKQPVNMSSTSKAKAAELYAKANSRPISVFKPLNRKSSFDKEIQSDDKLGASKVQGHRMTLRDGPRDSSTAAHPVSEARDAYITHSEEKDQLGNTPVRENFNSRFKDSDEEDNISEEQHAPLGKNLNSSTNLPKLNNTIPTAPYTSQASGSKSGIDGAVSNSRVEREEKKSTKKFKKLRKLFGKN
ncbi:uncharacterized protein PRCAT00000283001 [Priceomyces carsonii]|uniref:uncharacterized protein n=1 Tax=Priceomyces carsonii TaxID=28549 RepID=UPI002ED92E2C|nr:unnamed protein product [Priceomyces carsonii]